MRVVRLHPKAGEIGLARFGQHAAQFEQMADLQMNIAIGLRHMAECGAIGGLGSIEQALLLQRMAILHPNGGKLRVDGQGLGIGPGGFGPLPPTIGGIALADQAGDFAQVAQRIARRRELGVQPQGGMAVADSFSPPARCAISQAGIQRLTRRGLMIGQLRRGVVG